MRADEHNQRSCRRYFISGYVQGVGFRYYVEQRARQLGIDGYTRNLPDGRVEVYACGSAGSLQELRTLLQTGPPASKVRRVEEAEAGPESVSGFRIQR